MVRFILPLLILWNSSTAQIWPVQCYFSLSQPHSSWLPDIAENVSLHLELTDTSEPSLDVFLVFHIEGNGFTIETDTQLVQQWLTLTPFNPLVLTSAEVEYYISPERMIFNRISRSEYEEWMRFPEGEYTICVEVRAYLHPDRIPVSNASCQSDWFVLADSPIPTFPICGSQVEYDPLQNILFEWDILHGSTPGIAEPVHYLLEMWEVFPDNADPEEVAQTSMPFFNIETTDVFYQYTLGDAPLGLGKNYCWRITARDNNYQSLFTNEGRSAVCSFEYTPVLDIPFVFTLEAFPLTPRKVLIQWNAYSIMQKYRLQIRKQGTQNWFEFQTDSNAYILRNLESQAAYEAMVMGEYESGTTNWSNIITFSTPAIPTFSCNASGIPTVMPTDKPAQVVNAGSHIKCGDFELELSEVNPGTGPGFFSGNGRVAVFAGLRLHVSFQSVFINEDLEVVQGEVRARSTGINNWSGIWDYENSWIFPGDADSVYLYQGHVYVISANGDTTMVNENYQGGLLITDQNGEQWLIQPDGTIIPIEGQFLLPVNNTPLSQYELEILSRALTYIHQTVTQNSIDSLKAASQLSTTELKLNIAEQRRFAESLPESEGEVILMGKTEIVPENHTLSQINRNYKTTEELLLVKKLLLVLPNEINDQPHLNLLGSYLIIGSKSYSTWLAEQQGPPEILAKRVAEEGIQPLVVKVIKRKMK